MGYKERHPRNTNTVIILIVAVFVWITSGIIAGYTLRQNNLRMLELREAVFEADESGGDVNAALTELQQFVTTTMNTSLPKLGEEKAIQLKSTYEKMVAAEQARVASERQRVTQEATAYCEATLPNVRLTERVPCVQNYIAARPVVEKTIQKDLYTFDFVSPRWSPDLAGMALILFIVSSLAIFSCAVVMISRRKSRA